MIEDIKFIFINLFVLIIWFRTDVFYEYVKYIPFIKILRIIKKFVLFKNKSNGLSEIMKE